MVFDEYAKYYDLLYRDKDYAKEAAYINALLNRFRYGESGGLTILEIGCGTGKHADLLSKSGHNVLGIDYSAEMLNEAQKLAEKNSSISFLQGDIREFNIDDNFDMCISLFHVMSYINAEEDFIKVLENVKKSLKANGIFIFDTWYGPAVLSQQPEVRVKRFSDEHCHITRIAEPVMRESKNVVEVNYDIFVENNVTGLIKEIKETHKMRYWFVEEIKRMAKQTGFIYKDAFEFGTDKSLSCDTWGSCFILEKQ